MAVGLEGSGNINGFRAFVAAIERLAFGPRHGNSKALFGQLGRLHWVKDTVSRNDEVAKFRRGGHGLDGAVTHRGFFLVGLDKVVAFADLTAPR